MKQEYYCLRCKISFTAPKPSNRSAPCPRCKEMIDVVGIRHPFVGDGK